MGATGVSSSFSFSFLTTTLGVFLAGTGAGSGTAMLRFEAMRRDEREAGPWSRIVKWGFFFSRKT